MKYTELVPHETKKRLRDRIGSALLTLTAPQVVLDPLHRPGEYVFPWLSLCLERGGNREYLNLSFEKRQTAAGQEYHRLHIIASDTPSCEHGTHREYPYDASYPAVLMDIGAHITDVHFLAHTAINDETGEEIEEESTVILHLDNGASLRIAPQFLGDFVSAGYMVLRIIPA
jgi:hypothetical protein